MGKSGQVKSLKSKQTKTRPRWDTKKTHSVVELCLLGTPKSLLVDFEQLCLCDCAPCLELFSKTTNSQFQAQPSNRFFGGKEGYPPEIEESL